MTTRFGIAAADLNFVDGSGGGDSAATPAALVTWLQAMSRSASARDFHDAQPALGVDGSLSFVTAFASDPSLAGARGQVHAKTGTYVVGSDAGPVYKAQALAGYMLAKSGRRLAFALIVNDVGLLASFDEVLSVFQDEGTISAILWKTQ